MSQALSEEEFARLQAQLIELKTSNYSHEEQARRSAAEISQLRDRVSQLDRELQKANKIVGKSKKAKDVSGLIDENESLQRKIHGMEEQYQLQNRTLMAELTKVCDDNEALKMRLTAAGVNTDSPQGEMSDASSDRGDHSASVADLESQVRRLTAENAAFQKTLDANRERHQQEIADMKRLIESVRSSRSVTLGGRSPAVMKRDVTEHERERNPDDVVMSDLIKEFDHFFKLLAEKERNWKEECDSEESNQSADLESVLTSILNEAHRLKDEVMSSLGKAQSQSQECLDETEFDPSELSAAQEDVQRLTEANTALRQELREKEGLQINLDSLEEERRLLQEKLQWEQENSHTTRRRLETEVDKLNEKLKKKQESLVQLQEEKEKLYNESQSSLAETIVAKDHELEVMMQQSAKVQQELDSTNAKYREFQLQAESTVRQLQDSLMAAESQARGSTEASGKLMDELRRDRETMAAQLEAEKTKSTTWEREVQDARVQLSDSETMTAELQTRNASLAQQSGELRAQLDESQTVCQGLLEQNDALSEEKKLAVQELDKATKLADKRKTMLDELSMQTQRDAEEAQKHVKSLQDEHESAVQKMKSELQTEREKFQELVAEARQRESSEKELERVRDNLATAEREKEELKEQVQQAVAEREEAVEEVRKEIEILQTDVQSAQQEKKELEDRLTAQQQAIQDKQSEMKLSEKKGSSLMKDLKRQLQQEKRRCEKLQEQLTETRGTKLTAAYDEGFGLPLHNNNALKPPSREGSVSSLTGSLTMRESGSVQSYSMPLTDETTALLAKVTQLKEENWSLEERVRHLETNASCLAEDVMQKSAIIQQHYMDVKGRVSDVMPSPKQSRSGAQRVLGGLSSPFRGNKDEENQKEVIAKMQRVLEETLMKNIHLQKNLEQLVEELNQTQTENGRLRERLGIESEET